MNHKLQIEIDRLNISWNKFRQNLKIKDFRIRFIFGIFSAGLTITLLLFYLSDVFIPILSKLQFYTDKPNHDPIIALSVLGFIFFGIWFVAFPLPRILTYPIAKRLGIIGIKKTMPKGFKF